jgi:hypothetical protein
MKSKETEILGCIKQSYIVGMGIKLCTSEQLFFGAHLYWWSKKSVLLCLPIANMRVH